jgi:hypothetical protein
VSVLAVVDQERSQEEISAEECDMAEAAEF